MVKKEIDKSKTKSKHFRQKDFVLAKKAIKQMEKRQWKKALSISKKAKDKSIYNFIQWKHLLTTGNQASFYEYKIFIDKNKNYPRIGRIKYLAEHKLSTSNLLFLNGVIKATFEPLNINTYNIVYRFI